MKTGVKWSAISIGFLSVIVLLCGFTPSAYEDSSKKNVLKLSQILNQVSTQTQLFASGHPQSNSLFLDQSIGRIETLYSGLPPPVQSTLNSSIQTLKHDLRELHAHRDTFEKLHALQQHIDQHSIQLNEAFENLTALGLLYSQDAQEKMAITQLQYLQQRIQRGVTNLHYGDDVDPEITFLLAKDVLTLNQLFGALNEGSDILNLRPIRKEMREQLALVIQEHRVLEGHLTNVLQSLQQLKQLKQQASSIAKQNQRLQSQIADL